ncbi:phosphotriesterase [Marmoricola endophyticus]|uniref:Phosphotriesterase n=1 Tax=Marmoricola endophyticus TaxID=2040280 RepID=A0A917BEB6_9ACTN|nr:hypothetical protein [Marmoricola endophyticus]GGF34539.1 phosphotriesterase [Marmoricola endophyticus]
MSPRSTVETVGGPVDVADLGTTYMHEHVFVLSTEVQQNYPEEWGSEDDRVADAVRQLTDLAASGVRTIVDLTVLGLGRDVPRVKRVAEQVPQLNVVVATGLYTYDMLPGFFSMRGPAVSGLVGHDVPDPLDAMFLRDIEVGIADTGVRAGMLKCAIDSRGPTKGVERVMRAVGRVHQRTGTPITVHTHVDPETRLAVERVLCDDLGVDPRAVVLGHAGDSTDCDHLASMADKGFVLGMDRLGIYTGESTFESRVGTIVEMCRWGYAERMVLSHDTSCYIDWVEPELAARMPQSTYSHIADEVLPHLRENGVTEEQIEQMLVGNPRTFFAGTDR